MTLQQALDREDRIAYNLLNHDDKETVHMVFDALREQDVTDINVGNKWISVKDRLPDEDGFYLVWGPTIYIGTKWYDQRNLAQYLWRHDVTHWMPLPEPPKGD